MGGVCRSWPVILLKTAVRLLIKGAQSPGRLAYSRPSMSFQRKPSRDRASSNFSCMLGEVPQSTLRPARPTSPTVLRPRRLWGTCSGGRGGGEGTRPRWSTISSWSFLNPHWDRLSHGTRPRWRTISSWSFLNPHWDRLSHGTRVARIFPRSIGPRALASFHRVLPHTHTADVAQACRNFTLGPFALPPPHSTPARTMH